MKFIVPPASSLNSVSDHCMQNATLVPLGIYLQNIKGSLSVLRKLSVYSRVVGETNIPTWNGGRAFPKQIILWYILGYGEDYILGHVRSRNCDQQTLGKRVF